MSEEKKYEYSADSIQALEGMIEILTRGFGKTMPPDENTVDSRKATKRPLGPAEDKTL
jgi:hypothetical protein